MDEGADVFRLRTDYGIYLDPKTRELLTNGWEYDENDTIAEEYSLRIGFYKSHPMLAYTMLWDDENEYRHKAIKRWLRNKIKELS